MERYIHMTIGFLALAGIVVAIIKRPVTPKLVEWALKHQWLLATVGPFVLLVWGATIWALLILKDDFSNVLAMVAASGLICTAVFLICKRFS